MSSYAPPFVKELKRGDTFHEAASVTHPTFDFTGSTAQADLMSDFDGTSYGHWEWDGVAGTITFAHDPGNPVSADPLQIQDNGNKLYIPVLIPHQLSRLLPETQTNKPLIMDIEITLPNGHRRTKVEINFNIKKDGTKTTD